MRAAMLAAYDFQRQRPARSATSSRERPASTRGMELRTRESNHRHGKIVRALVIANNVNNFHQAAGVGLRSTDPFEIENAMPSPRPLRRPKPYQRRALTLLAGCGSGGCTERVMRMHGFTAYQLAELVRVGFATTTVERMVDEWRQLLEVKRFKVTEAGDRALGGQQ
jgi:hypothetical protein